MIFPACCLRSSRRRRYISSAPHLSAPRSASAPACATGFAAHTVYPLPRFVVVYLLCSHLLVGIVCRLVVMFAFAAAVAFVLAIAVAIG
jgi:hypothetical protein